MTAFDRAAAVITADPNIGSDALYTAQNEPPLAIRVVMTRDEAPALGVGRGIVAGGHVAVIAAADIPDRVQRGELLSVGANDYTVETAELDEAGASWRVTLRRA